MYDKFKPCNPCGCPPPCPPDNCGPFSPVPPPIKPVCVIPGENIQSQMCKVVDAVNGCVNQWNYIQQNCYEALNKMVGAAVCNDVYYDRDEVKLESGYNANDECAYHIITIRCVDKAGQPIRMKLALAYGNTTNSNLRQNMQDVSFITNANAVITAVNPEQTGWMGKARYMGAPISGTDGEADKYVAGFNMNGVLKVFPSTIDEVTQCQNQIVDMIGYAIPIITDGEVTTQAQALTTKASISAIGYKSSNGDKVLFQCSAQDQPGMQGITVANLLKDMGCTTAVITSLNQNNTSGENNCGMMYMGVLTDTPNGWKIPNNVAYWIVSKRPFDGWNNKFTAEIAELVQKTGANWNNIQFMGHRVDEVTDTADTALDIAQDAQDKIATINQEITEINQEITTINEDITNLQNGLSQETQERKEADQQLQTNINAEAEARENADNELSERITAEQTAREQADQQLNTAIETETANRTSADATLQQNINQEAMDRAAADLQLSNQIAKEISDRTESDNGLQDQITGIISGTTETGYVRKIGDTMTGPLILPGNAAQDLQAVPKQQLDAETTAREQGDTNIQQQIANIVSGDTPIHLPIASAQTVGGIRVGQNLTITPEGVLNATGGGGGTGEYTAGDGIIISGTTISVDTAYFTENSQLLPYLPLAGGNMSGEIGMGNGTTNGGTIQAVLTDTTPDGIRISDATTGQIVIQQGAILISPANGETVSFANSQLKNIADPTEDDDATNKGYVDSAFVKKTGDTMSGALEVESGNTHIMLSPAIGVSVTESNNIAYLASDDVNGAHVHLSNDANDVILKLNGANLQIGGGTNGATAVNIKNVATPIDNNDAATKQYVDDNAGTTYTAGNGITISGNTISVNTKTLDGRYLKLSGGTMTGDINIGEHIIRDGQGESIFFDGSSHMFVVYTNNKAAFSVCPDFVSTRGRRIENVSAPVNVTDAATKGYVDSKQNAGISGNTGTITGPVNIFTSVPGQTVTFTINTTWSTALIMCMEPDTSGWRTFCGYNVTNNNVEIGNSGTTFTHTANTNTISLTFYNANRVWGIFLW